MNATGAVDRRHGAPDRRRAHLMGWVGLARVARLSLAVQAGIVAYSGLLPLGRIAAVRDIGATVDSTIAVGIFASMAFAAAVLVLQCWCPALRASRWAFLPSYWLAVSYLLLAGVSHTYGLPTTWALYAVASAGICFYASRSESRVPA